MTAAQPSVALARPTRSTGLILTWAITLAISTLPDILFRELSGQIPSWLFWGKLVLLAVIILAGFFWEAVRPLRQYFFIFIVIYLAEWAFGQLEVSSLWHRWFAGISFTTSMFSTQLIRVGSALVIASVLWIIKRHRSDFFLVKGNLAAQADPVHWLGINRPVSWVRFGWLLSLCITLGTLAFLIFAGRPSMPTLARALPLLPAVLLFAAMNAFSEEMSYRSPQLATLQGHVSKGQALLLSAAFFGIGHFYGVPYGILGVVMASILGWFLGKSMLETKGFLWPWFIHFLQDVAIFSFMAIGSIVAGG